MLVMVDTPTETVNIMNGEKISMDSIIVEDLPSQIKLESPGPLVSHGNFTAIHLKSHVCSDERGKRRAEINFKQNIKKLEKIYEIRGLPVDHQTLYSAANKDAFDMRGLNESLPTTSEKKHGCIEFRRKFHQIGESYPSWIKQRFGRLNGIGCSMSSYTSQLGKMLISTPTNSESAHGLRKLTVQTSVFGPLGLRKRRRARTQHKKIPASYQQKKTSEDGYKSFVERNLHLWKNQVAPLCLDVQESYTVSTPGGSTITTTHPNAELKEKSNDVEKNLQNVEYPPLIQPIWNSEKNWITDFQSPHLSVPLNSPTKWKVDANGSGSALSMAQISRSIQYYAESKLQLLNSHRGVSEEMDGSENKSNSSKEKTSAKRLCMAIRECQDYLNSRKDRIECNTGSFKQLIRMQKQVSSQSMRIIRSHTSLDNMNSDKVLPD